MANIISAQDLNALLQGKSKFALIDVREAGEYNSSHIADSSLIPRKELEFRMGVSAPVKGEKIIMCDDDGRRATLAAATLEGMGFGLPAVACRVGAVSEIVEHGANGFLIPPGAVSKLTHYIEQLIEDRSLLEKLSVNANRTYQRHPTWEESLAQVPSFLNKVINSHATHKNI